MTLGQRDIDIAAFADRLAVVERFKDREKAAVLLQEPRQRIEIPRATMAAQLFPNRLGLASGLDGGVDVFLCRLTDLRQRLAARRIAALEAFRGLRERPVNEVPEFRAVALEPFHRLGIAFRGWAIFHRFKNFFDGHVSIPLRAGSQLSRRPSHGVLVAFRYRPGAMRRRSGIGPAAASGRQARPSSAIGK